MPIPEHGRCDRLQIPLRTVRNSPIADKQTELFCWYLRFDVLFRIIEMFLPISEFYANAPEQASRLRKKELKPHNDWANDTNPLVENLTEQQLNGAENSTMLNSIATTTEYNELAASSSSSSVADHSAENSNDNRIWFLSLSLSLVSSIEFLFNKNKNGFLLPRSIRPCSFLTIFPPSLTQTAYKYIWIIFRYHIVCATIMYITNCEMQLHINWQNLAPFQFNYHKISKCPCASLLQISSKNQANNRGLSSITKYSYTHREKVIQNWFFSNHISIVV